MTRKSGSNGTASEFTRRDMLKAGAAGGGALLGGTALSVLGPARLRAQEVESELVLAGPGGASQKVLEEMLFPEFSKRHNNIKITLLTGSPSDNVARLRAQASNPSVDAIWLAGGSTYQAIDAGLVAPYDRSLIPNLADVESVLAAEEAAAPVAIAVVQLMYNIPLFQENGWEAPGSWFDLWDERFAGHVGLPSINISSAAGFLAKLSEELSGDEKNYDAAFAKLRELRPNMLNFYTSLGAMESALQQGDLWIGNLTAHRAYQLKNAGTPIGMSQPKEGGIGYQTWMGVVSGARHPNAAHAWINYLLSEDGQAKVTEGFGYTPVNPKVPVPPENKVYFPDIDAVFIPDWRYIAENLPEIVRRWNREVER